MDKNLGGTLVHLVIAAIMVLFIIGIIFKFGGLLDQNIDNQALLAYENLREIINNPTFTGKEERLYQFPEGYVIASYTYENWDNLLGDIKKFPQCKSADCLCLCAPNCEEYAAKCDEVFGFEFTNGEELIRGTGQPELYAFNLNPTIKGKRTLTSEHLA